MDRRRLILIASLTLSVASIALCALAAINRRLVTPTMDAYPCHMEDPSSAQMGLMMTGMYKQVHAFRRHDDSFTIHAYRK
jgi:hypothetical protein